MKLFFENKVVGSSYYRCDLDTIAKVKKKLSKIGNLHDLFGEYGIAILTLSYLTGKHPYECYHNMDDNKKEAIENSTDYDKIYNACGIIKDEFFDKWANSLDYSQYVKNWDD